MAGIPYGGNMGTFSLTVTLESLSFRLVICISHVWAPVAKLRRDGVIGLLPAAPMWPAAKRSSSLPMRVPGNHERTLSALPE